jgi:hypothetical protein
MWMEGAIQADGGGSMQTNTYCLNHLFVSIFHKR